MSSLKSEVMNGHKNAYRPLQWSPLQGWGVCRGVSAQGVSAQGGLHGGVCTGGCLPRGVCLGGVFPWDVCLGGCLSSRGICPGGVCPGGVCPEGVCPEGCLPRGGVYPRGVCRRCTPCGPKKDTPAAHYMLRHTHTFSPVNRMTVMYKHTTFRHTAFAGGKKSD